MKRAILALLICSSCLATPAFADEPPAVYLVDAGAPVADAGSGSNAGSGSAVVTAPPIDTLAGLQQRYNELRTAYEDVKDGDTGKPKTLAIAALLALVCKFLLDAVNRLAEDRWKKQLAWAALGLAVPIALLSKYAGGTGWFDALVYAGAGPGAIVVHELLARFRKPS